MVKERRSVAAHKKGLKRNRSAVHTVSFARYNIDVAIQRYATLGTRHASVWRTRPYGSNLFDMIGALNARRAITSSDHGLRIATTALTGRVGSVWAERRRCARPTVTTAKRAVVRRDCCDAGAVRIVAKTMVVGVPSI